MIDKEIQLYRTCAAVSFSVQFTFTLLKSNYTYCSILHRTQFNIIFVFSVTNPNVIATGGVEAGAQVNKKFNLVQ
jgi:hypothetical protein